jgi:hypothetical protein
MGKRIGRSPVPCGAERPLQQGEIRLKAQQTKVIETSQRL